MKLATLKLLTIFFGICVLTQISALRKEKSKLPDGVAFGYASNENILQNASVNLNKKIKNKLGIQRSYLHGENPNSFKLPLYWSYGKSRRIHY